MASSHYLEDYLESVAHLPKELKRLFVLMRDLDKNVEENKKIVERDVKKYQVTAKKTGKGRENDENFKQALLALQANQNKCIQLSNEKVELAEQMYSLVDRHIRKLDEELKKFEAELHTSAMDDDEFNNNNSLARKRKSFGGGGGGGGGSSIDKSSNKLKKKADEIAGRLIDDMPIDPFEPTYCLCNGVSYGEMVGCDNPSCKIEWFHFECVGLTAKPKGQWFCPDCSAAINSNNNNKKK